MFYKEDRLAVFIDGVSIHAASKSLGLEVDYLKLRQEFMRRGRLLRLHYYTTVLDGEEHQPARPLCDWLAYNGYCVTMKVLREYADAQGRRKLKGSIGIDLAVDALSAARHCDHIVLMTGDGEYRPLVEALQRQGVRVTVVSTITRETPMISDELRRQADDFIDLESLRDLIGRMPRHQDA